MPSPSPCAAGVSAVSDLTDVINPRVITLVDEDGFYRLRAGRLHSDRKLKIADMDERQLATVREALALNLLIVEEMLRCRQSGT